MAPSARHALGAVLAHVGRNAALRCAALPCLHAESLAAPTSLPACSIAEAMGHF